jgi:hypothetical protein
MAKIYAEISNIVPQDGIIRYTLDADHISLERR